MRYDIDSNNYITDVYFNCNSGTCVAYNGTIPSGYTSLEEWSENACIRAYKIVGGNLVLDNNKLSELQSLYAKQDKDNANVLYKDLYEIKEQIEDIQQISGSTYKTTIETGEIITVENAKKCFPKLKFTGIDPYKYNSLDVIVSKKNMLTNEATTNTLSGITFTQNIDRSITIDGTSTENIEYNIGGSSENTNPFLCLKKNEEYYLTSNSYLIKMYYYDGETRTQVYSGSGGSIIFTDSDKPVTQIVLYIASGTTINNATIYPQLEYGSAATTYETYQGRTLHIDFNDYIEEALYPSDDLYPSDNIYPKGDEVDYIMVYNGNIILSKNSRGYLIGNGDISIFDDYNIVYAAQNFNVEMTYCIGNLKLEGTVTKNNNFKILADGSIEANNGYFSGEIQAGSGVIGGFTIGQTQFYAEIQDKYTYTMDDYNTVMDLINSGTTPTADQLEKYDINKDGVIDRLDALAIQRKYYGYVSTSGTLSINTDDANSFVKTTGNASQSTIKTTIGIEQVSTNNVYSNNATINNITTYSLTNNSDIRLKENIEEISSNYIKILSELNPKSYKYKNNEINSIGFIAQELKEVFEKYNLKAPMLKEDDIGYYSIDYIQFIGVMWKFLQIQQKSIEELENRIREMEVK